MRLRSARALRILDFDTENRPLSYLGMDFTTAEITAIACSWVGEDDVMVWLLGRRKLATILRRFVEMYDQADIVTGHNIRRHDLPILNGALLEQGLPPLRAKLTQDTYLDLVKRSRISASQESLGSMLGLDEPKVHMGQTQWREANRLTRAGLDATEARVAGDVRQHKALRAELLNRRLLKPPKVWTP